MPKVYNSIPTKDQWKIDLGLKRLMGGNKKSPFPAMERLGRLIDEYSTLPGGGTAQAVFRRQLQLYYMFRQAQFVLKNNVKGKAYAKSKMGGKLSDTQLDAVQGLYNYISGSLTQSLNCVPNQLDQQLTVMFGKLVTDHGNQEDANAVAAGMMQWYQTDFARQLFKLSFRAGKANKWSYEGGAGKGTLNLYDTDAARDNIENGGSLYVMDHRGRIYVSGREGEQALKHSSFMAGGATQAAGTMRIERGAVKWFSGRSGHYQPTVFQMVNMIERLRTYAVDISKVTVYRENYTQEWVGTPWRYFEGCSATELLARRAWPTGVSPNSMRVI